jgi:hypothetical protein
MKRDTNRNKLFINHWYIGSGNKPSVFTRRANRPFEEIRELYLLEIESSSKTGKRIIRKDLKSGKDIKSKIKKRIIKQDFMYYVKSILSFLFAIGILILFITIIKTFIENLKYL